MTKHIPGTAKVFVTVLCASAAAFAALAAPPSPTNDPALMMVMQAEADAAQARKESEGKPPREVRKERQKDAKGTKRETPPKPQ